MTRRATRGLLLLASRLALAGLLASCRHQPPPALPTLEVEYRGCWAFYLPDQVCSLFPDPDRRLNLWVKTTPPDGNVEIHAGGQLLTAAGNEVDGGRYYRLDIPKHADRLNVSALLPDGNSGPSWSLRLAEPEEPVWFEEIEKLTGLGRKEEARKWLARLRESAPPKDQGFVVQWLATLARNDGDRKEEDRWLLQGWSNDHAGNRWSGEVKDAAWLAESYSEQGRFSDAEAILRKVQFPSQAPANFKYLVIHNRGLLADAVGDYRLALKQLRAAASLAERVGMDRNLWDTEQVRARILQDLGRSQEASALFERLGTHLPKLDNPCELGRLLTNAGWSLLRAVEAGEDAKNPLSILEQARDEFESSQCTPEQRLNARLNLVLAHQQAGRWPEARQELKRAQDLHTQPNLIDRFWWDDLEAREEIAEGHAERALGRYEELENMAERALSPEALLRSLLGQAKAHVALGRPAAAIDALAEADRQIDEQSRHIPVHEGLDTFFAQQEAATRQYLELLLAQRQQESALNLVRRSRSRLLRQLAVSDRLTQLRPEEQQTWARLLSRYRALRETVDRQSAQEWTLAGSEKKRARQEQAVQLAEAQDALDRALTSLGAPAEGDLSPPEPGEVILAYHPLLNGKWAGFAATVRGIEVVIFKLPVPLPSDPEQLGRTLLTPSSSFQAAIKDSESVRILPYGPLRSVDFHALPFDGDRPLLATHRVAYSLDLPVHASLSPLSGQPVALVVSDPTSDLRTAKGEGERVAAAIQRWPGRWKLEPLDGQAARSGSVLRALPGASFFHYAGHGTFGGFAGWNSDLPLANRSRLTLSDVLSLPRTPDWIVLSACDAAHTSEEAPGEGIGLANAFLLAGSKGVVAARQQVPDRSADALMSELYGNWRPGEDLQRQLRRAQLACRGNRSSCQAAWASFRFLIP